MARALWSGAISFGLVNIPVKLYKATPADSAHGISFHQLHEPCGVRIQHIRRCPSCGKIDVPWDEIVNGYEFTRGRYAIIRKEELPAKDRGEVGAIAIEDFIDSAELDPMYIDRSYWIAPDGPARPYALLFQALEKTGRVAIARVVVRTRSHLAVVRPHGKHLVLSTMFFHEEMVREDEIPAGVEGVKVVPRELELANELIERMSAPFAPEKYKDEATAELRELVEQKIAEKAVTTEAKNVEVREGDVVDIMEALRRSVARNAEKRAEEAGAAQPGAPAPRGKRATHAARAQKGGRGYNRPHAQGSRRRG